MLKERNFKFLKNEFWYVGVVNDGYQFPLNENSTYNIDFSTNDTFNQIMPMALSSKGRFIYVDRGTLKFEKGEIRVFGKEIDYGEGYENLKGAYCKVRDKYFNISKIPEIMKKIQFQYCTWMALKTNQNQKGILDYAQSIIESGYPSGLLIIDDSWQQALGDWDFNERFENPKEMVERLHQQGFKVSLWIAPYISPSAKAFNEAYKNGLLLTNEDGSYFEANSWLGKSAVFDMCNPNTVAYFTKLLDGLCDKYGIDGFKFDGGDEAFIRGANTDCVKQNEIWCSFYKCDIVECRSAYKMGGAPVIQRLADKAHQWNVEEVHDLSIQEEPFIRYGLSSVIPDALIQGLCGYYYTCPDMVGGGLSTTLGDDTFIDEELVIRNCQTEVLMPYVQFSYPFWSNNPMIHKSFLECFSVRAKLQSLIDKCFDDVLKTGEPMLRLMEYQFPNQGFEAITDQFMLGEDVLIAPVCKQGAVERKIQFPQGKWKRLNSNQVYTAGTYTVTAVIDELPVFIKEI